MEDNRKMSRRSMLKSAALMAGAACVGTLAPRNRALAQQKASKTAMNYQDKPNGAMKCGNCVQFEPPASCKVVEGTISPEGYCIAWVKKA
jgi:hypothetical protein